MRNLNPVVAAEHARIEQTTLARMLEKGTVDRQSYINYLRSSLTVWIVLEAKFDLAKELGVADRLLADLLGMTDDMDMRKASDAAKVHAARVREADLRVLGLGLCYGGKTMAKRIRENTRFPFSHFHMPEGAREKLREIDAPQADVIEAFARTTEWYRDAVNERD